MSLEDKIEYDEMINYVMDGFDYDKVQKVMEVLEWKWYGLSVNTSIPDTGTIPSVFDLKQHTRKELREHCKRVMRCYSAVGECVPFSTSTGGFRYIAYKEHGEIVQLELIFEIDSSIWGRS